MLIYIFGTTLGWVPIVGEGFVSLILPSINFLFFAGGMARLTRSSLVDVLTNVEEWNVQKEYPNIEGIKTFIKKCNDTSSNITWYTIWVTYYGSCNYRRSICKTRTWSIIASSYFAKDIPLVQALVVYDSSVYFFKFDSRFYLWNY